MEKGHATHFEDLIFCPDVSVDDIIETASNALTLISDANSKPMGEPTYLGNFASLKIDGSPAIVAGWFHNKFFVSSKSIFNKNPVLNFSIEDIERNHKGNIVNILKTCYEYLNTVIPMGCILQGDYLFSDYEVSNAYGYSFFQPNVIMYKIPALYVDSEHVKMGIVFHTQYSQVETQDLSNFLNIPTYTDIPFERSNKFVYAQSSELVFRSNSRIDSAQFKLSHLIAELKKMLVSTNSKKETNILRNPSLIRYINWCYRNSKDVFKITSLDSWAATKGHYSDMYNNIVRYNSEELSDTLNVWSILRDIRETILELITENCVHPLMRGYLVTKDKESAPIRCEGIVLTSGPLAGTKLVNREKFSIANFSNHFKKGWKDGITEPSDIIF